MTIKKDPNLDTEWNDVLRAKGILPPKEEKEITEEDLIKMVESTIENKSKELEWMLSQTGAVNIDLEEALRGEVKDVMNIAIRDSAKKQKG
ncbi:hypothetical protein DPMN_071109 [Dreissena polymorpha]|uniref:Uncharacterized protein n=1 Tax=Dreissena polymorpha TaxID=45954 RepID=A0A9D4BVI0_DREPO|nr:hypothetical protein DPMN_071109 [Dreissena polymorpha]